MPDREKVISNLAILRTWCAVNPDYGVGLSVNDCKKVVMWLDAALELLKAQEPIEPIQDMVGDALFWVCGKCGHDLISTCRYCANCGRAVKWNG